MSGGGAVFTVDALVLGSLVFAVALVATAFAVIEVGRVLAVRNKAATPEEGPVWPPPPLP